MCTHLKIWGIAVQLTGLGWRPRKRFDVHTMEIKYCLVCFHFVSKARLKSCWTNNEPENSLPEWIRLTFASGFDVRSKYGAARSRYWTKIVAQKNFFLVVAVEVMVNECCVIPLHRRSFSLRLSHAVFCHEIHTTVIKFLSNFKSFDSTAAFSNGGFCWMMTDNTCHWMELRLSDALRLQSDEELHLMDWDWKNDMKKNI